MWVKARFYRIPIAFNLENGEIGVEPKWTILFAPVFHIHRLFDNVLAFLCDLLMVEYEPHFTVEIVCDDNGDFIEEEVDG